MSENFNQEAVKVLATSSRPLPNSFDPQTFYRESKPVSTNLMGQPAIDTNQAAFHLQQSTYSSLPQQYVYSNQTIPIGPKIMQPTGKTSVPFGRQPPIAQSPPIQVGPVQVLARNIYEYPRSDQIKTNTTFYSKNNVYSDIDSSSSLGLGNWQAGHFRNPSIQVQDNTSSGHVTFTNYCSACGRGCACPRNLNQVRRG